MPISRRGDAHVVDLRHRDARDVDVDERLAALLEREAAGDVDEVADRQDDEVGRDADDRPVEVDEHPILVVGAGGNGEAGRRVGRVAVALREARLPVHEHLGARRAAEERAAPVHADAEALEAELELVGQPEGTTLAITPRSAQNVGKTKVPATPGGVLATTIPKSMPSAQKPSASAASSSAQVKVGSSGKPFGA